MGIQFLQNNLLERFPFPHSSWMSFLSYIKRSYMPGSLSGLSVLFHQSVYPCS